MKNPKVTVLMSVYNGEKYLREAVDSILAQTFRDFEFLIINDGSTDRTGEILKSYSDQRIKIINHEKNIGLTKSLNKGLRVAKGEYVARQDADDISMPERLDKEVAFLDTNKNVGLVGTDYFLINEKDKIIDKINCLTESKDLKEKLLEGNQFAHGSIVFKKECIEKVGMYREEFKFAQDFDFVLRISEIFHIANIPEFLYKWRINIDSVSVNKKTLQDKYALLAIELAKERREKGRDKLQYLPDEERKKFLDSYLFSSIHKNHYKEISNNYFFWSKILYQGKDYTGALKLIFKGILSNPTNIELWSYALKIFTNLIFPKPIINLLRYIKRIIFF